MKQRLSRRERFPAFLLAFACLLVTPPAWTATVTVSGDPGTPGATGTTLVPDGGDGDDGDNASATIDAFPPADSVYTATAFGGAGGAGGAGTTGGDGGDGGDGGNATAHAVLNRDTAGPVTVNANAHGGRGGHYGNTVPTGTSGVGGLGGDAHAFGEGTTASADNVTVRVFSDGGDGGRSSNGRPPDGGNAFIDGAFGQSGGGRVIVEAIANGGNGGSGLNNANGLFVGVGGNGADVVLDDAVDGVTTGNMFLTQHARGGNAGGGLRAGTMSVGFPAARAGSAVSLLERAKSQIGILNVTSNATGGNGAEDTLGQGAGDGAHGQARAVSHNLIGAAAAIARAEGGSGGSSNPGITNLLRGPAAGDGADADAYAEADGVNGAILARATAFGGRGGFILNNLNDAPGSGGDALARAVGRHGGSNQLTVEAIADGGWGGLPAGGNPGPFITSRGGGAEAFADGTSTGSAASVTAFARSSNAFNASPALAHARATAPGGAIEARAISAAYGMTTATSGSLDVTVGGNIAGSTEVLASAYHNGLAGGAPQTGAAQAGATVGTRMLGGVLNEISLFAAADPAALGPQTFTMAIDLRYAEDPAITLSPLAPLLIDLSAVQIAAAGFDQIDFSATYVNTGVTVHPTLVTVNDALLFFSAPIDLGPIGNPFLNGSTLDLLIRFSVTLSAPGQSVALAAVPLPPAMALLALPLLALARRRRKRTVG